MRVVTGPAAFRATARDAPAGARVPVEVRIHVTDPFVAYRRARGRSAVERSPGAYLETTGGQSGWGYFAVEPTAVLQVSADAVSLAGATAGADGADQIDAVRPAALDARRSPSLAALRALLNNECLVRDACDVPYPCGAIGWLSYDVARELEDLPGNAIDDRNLPRLQLATFDRMAAWREPREGETMVRITACPRVDDDPEVVYERGLRRASALARRAVEGDTRLGRASTDRLPVDRSTVTFESDCTPDEFAKRVQRVKAAIRAGDTFQANISQRLTAPAAVHPVEAFAALRRVNPAPYSALLEFPGLDLVSASPELLLDVTGDRLLTEPIAGTRPRGATPDEDTRLEQDLRGDEKERAEHAMLVDLERNDLGKVADYGSVHVPEYRRIDRYSEVMHLVSVVEGRLREDDDLVDALAAVFPGGTITGAPKPRTMEIIDEVEQTRRGPYTGSVGIFGFDGRATLNIIIRTLVRHADEYHLRVGAGIVHDSEPIREYGETLDKARALVTAIDEAPGERADLAVETQDHR